MHLSIKIQARLSSFENNMAYLEKESQKSLKFRKAIFRRLGGLVLKEERKEAITLSLQGKDVLAVLPTGFVFNTTVCRIPLFMHERLWNSYVK